ncbi:monovalent cation:H+ antiporter, CPA1 (nhx1) [Coemansia sp. RSA 2050]|nr:monovalent cation:H+ antiporter, CPA1 (nhx1) [Coemansia sp. RSA 2050]KAJ2734240.1 monovalent cation:H+ antiporter, CPA1 (nhx1) [Coemansia sp. BCRC 34962]
MSTESTSMSATATTASTATTTSISALAMSGIQQILAGVVSTTTSAVLNPALATTVPDSHAEPPPEEEERASSQALLILVSLLIAALLTSYYLQRWRIRTVHETVLSIFAGMVVGLVLRFNSGSYIQRMVTFDHTIFFNMLLPPIILNCGYNLQKTSIARNIPSVLTFAFIGTIISAVVIGVLVQIYSFTGIESIGFSLLDSLILGTILSATDPVTILAVFEQLRVDPKLFSIIFGETVFNDAVAIVLFVTLSNLRASGRDFTFAALPSMLASFMFVFSASLLVGVAMGVFMALLCKHTRLYKYPSIEASLVLLLAYQAYLFSNAIELSGIVSLLFCAATMRQYAYRSLSIKSKRATRYLFHLLSGLAENFVFIYLGISLFTSSDVLFRPVFIIFVMISTCISRYSAIFPLSRLLNAIFKYRHPSAPSSAQPVTHEEQTMLFWAGLRGAVAVALASEVSGATGPLLRTTVLCVVVLSVTIFGGTTPQVVHQLGIRTGVPQPDSSDEDDDDDGGYDNDWDVAASNSAIIDLPTRDNDALWASAAARMAGNHSPSSSQLGAPLSDHIPMSRIPSSWSQSGDSWLSRIKASYRSFDRSLIYDLDRNYIQPLLTRSRESRPPLGLIRGGRSHEDPGSRDSLSGTGQSHARGPRRSPPIRHAYSSSDSVEDGDLGSSSWPSNYPAETDLGSNWASSASDMGSPNRQSRNHQPLLKKST